MCIQIFLVSRDNMANVGFSMKRLCYEIYDLPILEVPVGSIFISILVNSEISFGLNVC